MENLSESFTYDDLNRLESATTRSGVSTSHLSYDYDAHGNLTRNRLGTLEYGQTNGASLYGVTTAGGNAYGYDAYGNATTLGSRAAQYDVFNKPTRIGNTQFVYGPAHEKVKTLSGGTTTYHYAGGGYLEENTGSNLTSKAYVGGYYLRETASGAVNIMKGRWVNFWSAAIFGNSIETGIPIDIATVTACQLKGGGHTKVECIKGATSGWHASST